MDEAGEQDQSVLKKHRPYFIVFIAFVEVFIICGLLFNYSILFVSLQDEFDSSAVLTGWVGSLANTVLGFGSPVSTPLIRRYGTRTVALVGAVLYSAGIAATSFVPALGYAYLTLGVIAGTGASFTFQTVMTLVMVWFPGKTSSRGVSLALLGSSFGVLAFAPLLNALIPAYGWRNTLRIISGGSLVLSFAPGVFITEPTSDQTAQDVTNKTHCKTVEKDSEENVDDGQLEHEAKTIKQKYARVFHKIDAWLWLSALVLIYIGLTFVIINFASFLEYDLLFTSDQVSITFVLFAVGEIIGKLLLSIVGGLFPFRKLYVMAFGSLLAGGASGLLTVLRTAPLVYTLTLILGLSRAVCFVMPFPAALELFGDYGLDIATVLVVFPFGVGILIGAPLSGGLYDLTGDYTLSLLVVLGIFTLSSGLLLIIPIRRKIRSRGLPESPVQS